MSASNKKFYTDVQIKSDIIIDGATPSAVPIYDAQKKIKSSVTTAVELAHLSGVTSNVQIQIDNAQTDATQALADSAAAQSDIDAHIADTADAHDASAISVVPTGDLSATNVQAGLVELQGDIDSLEAQIAALPDPIYYSGTWDASTNTPTLSNSDTGVQGALYYVTVAGTVDFGAGSISFEIGDKVVNNGTTWDKWDQTDQVISVFGRQGAVIAQSGDYNTSQVTENTNLYFTDERAQDAVGTILVDSTSIDFTYNDTTPSITAEVIPGGVDHDALLNFVSNEHVDHSTVQIATAAATSGLSGGGDITATRNLVVDITGTTALGATPDNADELLIWDTSASARKKVTYQELLAGVDVGSAGDISETSFSFANNQASPANVTGLAFANGVVRSFQAIVSVYVDASSDLFEQFELNGIQRGADWAMSIESEGDDSGLAFSITNAGQVQYTSANAAGFSAGTIKFRAITTSV